MGPILDSVVDSHNESNSTKVVLVKVNVDDNEESPEKYNVSGIPAVFLFKNG